MNLLVKIHLKLLVLSISILFSSVLLAHEQSISRISIIAGNSSNTISWQVSLKDIARVINLDNNHDNNIQWKEVVDNTQRISKLLHESIEISSLQGRCLSDLREIGLVELSSGNGLNLNANLICPSSIVDIRYSFLENLDKLHIAHVDVEHKGYKDSFLFNKHSNYFKLLKNEGNQDDNVLDQQWVKYIYQGVVHIWIGLDHLAFLLILLFSARTKELSKAVDRRQLFSFITAFTIAHSVTLIAASMDFIQLPSWFVESIIAGSVGWGAYLVIKGRKFIDTPTVFGFGLIHGLGFASVLSDLTGMASSSISLLLAFNLGVELGQIVFLLLVSSFLYIPINIFGFQKIARFASIPILLTALVWMIERISDAKILVFA